MKNGDTVKITDGSYIQEITKDGLVCVCLNCGESKGLQYKVISTNCKFPKIAVYQEDENISDMIICGIEGCVKDRFFVVCHRFLKCVDLTHIITIDGKDIEISDESYQNLKESLAE